MKKKKKSNSYIIILAVIVLFCIFLVDRNNDESSDGETTGTITTAITESPETVYTTENTTENTTAPKESLEFFLTAGEAGEYGELVTYNPGTDLEETMYIYHVPAGTYTVTNIGQYMTQVNVYDNEMTVDENGYHQYTGVGPVELIDVNASVTITVGENQHIEIAEPSVIELKFQ